VKLIDQAIEELSLLNSEIVCFDHRKYLKEVFFVPNSDVEEANSNENIGDV
jgi:hypothetical protein